MVETLTGERSFGEAASPAPAHPARHGWERWSRQWGGAVLGLLAAACIGGPDPTPPARSAPADTSSSPEASSVGAPAGPAGPAPRTAAAVERAYRQFWATAQAVDQRPPERWRPILSTVAAEPLLDQLLDGLADQRRNGTVMYGTVIPRPTVAQIARGRATVMDCQDASRSGELDADTGAIQRVGTARTPVAAVLRYDAQARAWRVTEARYLAEPC